MPDAKSETIPAATILMLRDGEDGLEVFMVVRHHQIDFASGALVFPGGKVATGDDEVRDLCDGAAADETGMALQVGAIREAFEECGILLARANGESGLISGQQLGTLEHYREPLAKGEMPIRDLLVQHNLRLACDQLVPYAHWITPEMMPKRFDTHFYLATAPEDHLAIHDGQESVDSVWITPEAAIQGANDGTYTVIFPTRLNIEMLAASQSVESALRAAQQREIVSVLPWTEERADGRYICIPTEAGYAVSAEKMVQNPR